MRRLTFRGLLALCLSLTLGGAALARDHGCLTECSPRFGIVSAFGAEADILLANTSSTHQYLINGNTFTTGVLSGNRVVIVLTGVSIENAAMLTQIMIDHFNVDHLLLSGIAGGVDPANHIGDVIIPDKWAFPLETYWNGDSNVPSPCGTPGDISCLGLQLSTFTSTSGSDYAGTCLFMRDTFVRTSANYPNGEFLFDYHHELNSPYRVEDLVLVKRQIEIGEHLVGIGDRREKLQHFVRKSGSHDA